MNKIRNAFTRKKDYNSDLLEETATKREGNGLNLFSLTTLGVAPAIGIGVYVITGQVAREVAGPSVVISFLIAGIAAALSGLCYSELATRMPKAGSAYTYTYVAIGEFLAFIVGWSLILEYIIGTVSIAKCITLYIDYFAEDVLKDTFIDIAPIDAKFLGEYYDFCTFGISLLVAFTLAFGLKVKLIVRVIFIVINVIVTVIIIIGGAVKSDANNWSLAKNTSDPNINQGEFFPFGATGVLTGAAICFFAFIGFETIVDKANKAANPKGFIPIAIIASLFTILLCFITISIVLTTMIEFYYLDENAPIIHVFDYVGLEPMKWIVGIFGLFCLFTTLFELAFALQRLCHRMADDGIIFNYVLKKGCSVYRLLGILVICTLSGFFGGLFTLFQLVNMMSIATLFVYGTVAASVLVLRYGDDRRVKTDLNNHNANSKVTTSNQNCCSSMFNIGGSKQPTTVSQKVANIYILTYCILSMIVALLFFFLIDVNDVVFEDHSIVLLAVFGGFALIVVVLLAMQPTTEQLPFKIPLIPLVPCLSILINFYLMLMLEDQAWIRFGAWLLIGIPLYFFLAPDPKHHTNKSEALQTVKQTNGHTNLYPEEETYVSEQKSEDSGIVTSAQSMEELQNTQETMQTKSIDSFSRRKKSETSVDVVLAELDNVISNEDNNIIDDIGPSRKASIESAPDCGPVDVNVVALVHSEDVITPKAEIAEPVFVDDKGTDDNNNVEDIPNETSNEEAEPEITENKNIDTIIMNNDDITVDKSNHDTTVSTSPVRFAEEMPEGDKVQPEEGTITPIVINNDNKHDPKEDTDDHDSTVSTSTVSFAEEITESDKLQAEEGTITPIVINNDNKHDPKEDTDDRLIEIENSIISSNSSSEVSLKLRNEDNDYETDIDDIPDPIDPAVVPVIPPPPPLEGFETYKSVQLIPRINIKKVAKKEVRPPHTPDVDYSRGSSVTDLEERQDSDNNASLGSKGLQGYGDIKQKLTEIYGKRSGQRETKLTKPAEYEREEMSGSQTLKPVMSKVISEIVKSTPAEDETKQVGRQEEGGVDNRSLENANDIRNRLNDIFKSGRKPNSPKEYVRRTAGKEVVNNPAENKVTPTDNLQNHKRNMFNTLNSIKLRKVDSFN